MIIALASPRIATSLDDGLARIERLLLKASEQRAELACFPEAYLPGLRGQDFDVIPWDAGIQQHAIDAVVQFAKQYRIAVILSIEVVTDAGRQISACVIGTP